VRRPRPERHAAVSPADAENRNRRFYGRHRSPGHSTAWSQPLERGPPPSPHSSRRQDNGEASRRGLRRPTAPGRPARPRHTRLA
jgi:hypothetical protein